MSTLKDRYNKATIGDETGSSFVSLTPDNYVCKIVDVIDNEEKEFYQVSFDIANGEFKDYYKDQFEYFKSNNADAKWPFNATIYFSYKENNIDRFRTNIDIIERSNAGYNLENTNFDEKSLIGKLFVIPFLNHEIPKPDLQGNPKIIVKPNGFIRSLPSFQAGEVPAVKLDVQKLSSEYDLKKWAEETANAPVNNTKPQAQAPAINVDDLPF